MYDGIVWGRYIQPGTIIPEDFTFQTSAESTLPTVLTRGRQIYEQLQEQKKQQEEVAAQLSATAQGGDMDPTDAIRNLMGQGAGTWKKQSKGNWVKEGEPTSAEIGGRELVYFQLYFSSIFRLKIDLSEQEPSRNVH